MSHAVAIAVTEPSQVGETRRKAMHLASTLGFDEVERGKVSIVVMEAATNLIQHGQGGALLLQALEKDGIAGIELLALDKGPGMADLNACLQDGFSTAGTAGNGLGALHRLCHLCEIYSMPQLGTAVLCQIWAGPPPAPEPLELGVVCLPKLGEAISGDAWSYSASGGRHLLLVADGLGHGALAAQASLEAVRAFQQNSHRNSTEIVAAAHTALHATRGAALAISAIDATAQTLAFTGVGNISSCVMVDGRSSSMVSHHGTVGHEIRKVQEFHYPWSSHSLLVMHSDGLSTQWRLDRYPGLSHRHPSLIAGVLYRDFCRGRDDVTILVARESQPL